MAGKGPNQELKPQSDVVKAIASASDAVLGAALLTGLGAWGGLFLDEKLNASPWFAVTLGLMGGGLGLGRMLMKALAAEKESEGRPQSSKGDDKPAAIPDNAQDPGSDSLL